MVAFTSDCRSPCLGINLYGVNGELVYFRVIYILYSLDQIMYVVKPVHANLSGGGGGSVKVTCYYCLIGYQ